MFIKFAIPGKYVNLVALMDLLVVRQIKAKPIKGGAMIEIVDGDEKDLEKMRANGFRLDKAKKWHRYYTAS